MCRRTKLERPKFEVLANALCQSRGLGYDAYVNSVFRQDCKIVVPRRYDKLLNLVRNFSRQSLNRQ